MAAFLAGRCRFVDIPALVERALEACSSEPLQWLASRCARPTRRRARRVREALEAGVPG